MKHLVDNNFNTNKLQNVPTPIDLSDAVNKAYVDNSIVESRLVFNIEDYGAVGDGVTECQAAIEAADAAAVAAGGGIVFYPQGTWLVNFRKLTGTQRAAIVVSPKVIHMGAGVGTVVQLANNANCHIFALREAHDAGVRNLTVQGNRLNQSDPASGDQGSGIILLTDVYRATIRDVQLYNIYDYGIGVQLGTATDILIDNVLIDGCNADGMDWKNTDDISSNNRISNVTIRNFGLNGYSTPSTEKFAGLDLRGEVLASKVRVESFGSGLTGIRLMPGETGASGGLGAHKSSLSQFHIKGASTANSIGLHARANSCTMSDGVIDNVGQGLVIAQRDNNVTNLIIRSCTTGLVTSDDETDGGVPLPTAPHNCSFTNLNIRLCATGALLDGIGNTLVACNIRDNTNNVSISASGQRFKFIGGEVTSPSGGFNFADNGTRTSVVSVYGVNDRPRAVGDTVMSSQTTSSTSWVDFTTSASVTIDVPTSGEVRAHLSLSRCSNSTTGVNLVNFRVSGANTATPVDVFSLRSTGTGQFGPSMTRIITGLTPGSTTFTVQGRVSAGTMTIEGQSLVIEPLG